jgi:hypothetical protein
MFSMDTVTPPVSENEGCRRLSPWPARCVDTRPAPGWCTITHHATSDAQLFAMSDEPLLKYYRWEGAS